MYLSPGLMKLKKEILWSLSVSGVDVGLYGFLKMRWELRLRGQRL